MNCRSLTTSSSITTFRPALPSILAMVSITMFLLGMLDDAEEFQILIQRLQKGGYLHRASANHVIDLYHLVERLDLFAIIETTQVPSDSLVYLRARESDGTWVVS